MKIRSFTFSFTTALALSLVAGSAAAAPTLRLQVSQRGDFALIGNTLGFECAPGTPAPVVGAVGSCGTVGLTDSAPDVFWRADDPALGQALADNGIRMADARSTAVLSLPPGAVVTRAFLYWGARRGVAGGDPTATFERAGGFMAMVQADAAYETASSGSHFYQSVADVTALVQAAGPGPYRVGDVSAADIVDVNNDSNFAAWWLVVFYELATEPPRNLALFDGLDLVNSTTQANASLSGFRVPNAGFDAKLGVITYEGDAGITGDQLFFGGGMPLSDAQNPANNFFNGTRSFKGAPLSVTGDLPQLTGTPRSMAGIDLDVVDITDKLSPGQTSSAISATSSGDQYLLAGFVTSISTYAPDLSASQKTAVDLNGGALRPGDVLEYTIVATNSGNDASVGTVLKDALPAGVTFVPGSLRIVQGANAGTKTDGAGDDQGEYDGATRTVTVRLGSGATASGGGSLAIGESTTVVFRVTLDASASGSIANQATVVAGGALGAPPTQTVTDGNGGAAGAPPTVVVIDECGVDADCSAPTPICDRSQTPAKCVGCLEDSQCPGGAPTCDPQSHACFCVPTGPDVCDGIDNDCDGTIDNGCSDSDHDGLSDGAEAMLGTDPHDADSDDDGVPDGEEPNPGADTDGDGKINALDPDSDNDGLFDGTEMGKGCNGPGTDVSAGHCIPDADGGKTTTNPLEADTDGGGARDGDEDTNHNGRVDPGERDPNRPEDDKIVLSCRADSDCGGATSGMVCNQDHTCVAGCRGAGGNGCPSGQVCSSSDKTPGACGGAGSGGAGHGAADDVFVEGGGVLCASRPARTGSGGLWMLGAALGALLRRRRRASATRRRDGGDLTSAPGGRASGRSARRRTC